MPRKVDSTKLEMNDNIDIEKAIDLANKKGTTLDDMCSLIYADITLYQKSRETYYLSEFSDTFDGGVSQARLSEIANHYAETIQKKIQKDSKKFCIVYAKKSMDLILDAMNLKRFRYKKGPRNLLVLLDSLRELNES